MIKIKKRKEIIYSIYIFFFIFCPPIIPRLDVVLIVFSAFGIYIKHRRKVIHVLGRSGILFWVKAMIMLAWYILLIPLPISVFLYGDIVQIRHYISLINRYGLLVAAVSTCVVYLILELEADNYGIEDFLRFLFYAGAIESSFSLGALLFPNFKSFLILIMYKNTGNAAYLNAWYTTIRSYGFANTLVDLFGLGISIIASACFVYGVFRNKIYILLSAYIVISAALNARTGLILYIICIMITIIYLVLKRNAKGILLGGISILMGVWAFNFVLSTDLIDISTKDWITSGIESFVEVLEKGEVESGSLNILFRDSWWDLPKGIRLFIGTGHSRYQAEGYTHTDVGYVNEIWMAGLVGGAFLYITIIRLIYMSISRYKSFMIKDIGIIICIEYFVFNIKAVALGYNPGATAMLSILFVLIYFSRKKREGKNA